MNKVSLHNFAPMKISQFTVHVYHPALFTAV